MFNRKSGLVQIWYGAVSNPDGAYTYKDVPKLSNLRDVVGVLLIEIGYDINEENK